MTGSRGDDVPPHVAPLGRHAGRRYALGREIVDVIAVAVVLIGVIVLVSHRLWHHVPIVLLVAAIFASSAGGGQIARWRRSRAGSR